MRTGLQYKWKYWAGGGIISRAAVNRFIDFAESSPEITIGSARAGRRPITNNLLVNASGA